MTKAKAKTDDAAAGAPAVHTQKNTGSYVTVGCKLPVTGIELKLFLLVEKDEQTLQGMKTVKEAIPHPDHPEKYWIAGTSYPVMAPENFPSKPYMIAGAAFTPDIPRDYWEEWLQQNAKSDMVKNGMIFAHHQVGSVKAMAKEHQDRKSGLEPMNPATKKVAGQDVYLDRRMPKPINSSIERLKQADVARQGSDRLAEMMNDTAEADG